MLGVARLGGPLGLTLAVYLGGAGLAALAEAVVVAVRDGRRARAFARADTAGGDERVGTLVGGRGRDRSPGPVRLGGAGWSWWPRWCWPTTRPTGAARWGR